ncbi:MAG TPA: shikimate kinase, partial [Armatimonadota bacterium]|nr:shikimate kinase [Armatimonadota bacterium]
MLLGFMGAGKSAVGAALAAQLGWEHLDLDEEIERHEGRSVPEIFRDSGQAYFRALEAQLTRRLAERRRVVLSPGGGWITNPELLAGLPPGSLSVWLQVSPAEVLRRVRAAAAAGEVERPLLQTPDPAATVRELLAQREPLYRRAELAVS